MDPLTHSVCLFLHSMEETGTPWWLHLQTRSSTVICAASKIHPKPILYHLFDIMESYIPKKQQHLEYQMKNHDTYSLVQNNRTSPFILSMCPPINIIVTKEKENLPPAPLGSYLKILSPV